MPRRVMWLVVLAAALPLGAQQRPVLPDLRNTEVTLTWQDAESGLYCKSRADYYVPELKMVVDVKTAADASMDSFEKDCTSYRYPCQNALYRDAFASVGEQVEYFVFLVIEKEPPFAIGVYDLDAEGVGRGYTAVRQDIERLSDCIELASWPDYSDHIHTIGVKPWFH